jgi:hypothetical protein
VQASWQDGEGGRLVSEIAGEVVTGAEISYSYRQRCIRGFEWRVQRKARLEEEGASTPIPGRREEREPRRQLEQARIDRLLDEAASLRRAADIRAYVDVVTTPVARETASISSMRSSGGRNGRLRRRIALTR